MWSNKDPRDTYIDQLKTIVVYGPPQITIASVFTLGVGDGLTRDYWDVELPGEQAHLSLDADEAWPDHWWWCLLPDRGY
jgi:hypothetical protein